MNKIIIAAFFVATCGIVHATELKLEINCDSDDVTTLDSSKIGNTVTPAFQNPIHASDLSSSASPQYDIKSSGRYYAAENLTQEANGASDIIVRISASNVTLDLNSNAIVPHVSGSHSTGVGIALVKGKSNIQIMNGSIGSLDNAGTQKLSTGIDLSNSGSGTSYSIKLQGLYVNRCKANGITGTALNDVSIENCSVNDNYIASGNVIGLNLDTVKNLIIKNCEFNNNDADSGTCDGIKLDDCIDGIIKNTTTNNNQASGACSGIQLITSTSGCNNIKFDNINASNNNSSGAASRGFFVASGSSKLLSIKNSKFNNNNSAGAETRGIDLVGCTNSSIINCEANENNTSGTNAAGVVIGASSTSNYLENITANNNYTSADSSAKGFNISSGDNNLVKCNASKNRNTNTGSSTSAHAYGFFISGGSRNQFTECTAIGNSTTANEAVRAVGFYTEGGNNQNKFEKCKANANNASSDTEAVIAAGFQFNGIEARSQVINCEAANNLVGDGVASVSTARAYGIYFDTAAGTDQCIVKDCYLAYNSVTTDGKAFGFYDNNTSSTSLLTGNVAIGHGKSLGSTLDASMQWNNNSEPSLSQNYFFKHTGTGDDPRNAIQEVPRENFMSISTMVQKWQNISVYDS